MRARVTEMGMVTGLRPSRFLTAAAAGAEGGRRLRDYRTNSDKATPTPIDCAVLGVILKCVPPLLCRARKNRHTPESMCNLGNPIARIAQQRRLQARFVPPPHSCGTTISCALIDTLATFRASRATAL